MFLFVGNSVNRSFLDNEIIEQVLNNTGTYKSENILNNDEIKQQITDKNNNGIPDYLESLFNTINYNNFDIKYVDGENAVELDNYLKFLSKKKADK